MNKRKIIFIFISFVLVATASIYCSDLVVKKAAEGKMYSETMRVPYNKAGLLLGTGKLLKNGSVNPYYSNRIEAAYDLLKSGKIEYLIISGDNSRKDYNEPEEMKADLVLKGVDSAKIYLDYAGFRTFDSMVRAKEIFGQNSFTIISQRFHNERALYIASAKGISAVGFNAKDVGFKFGIQVQFREKLARVKVILDDFFGVEPKFLSEKIQIP